MTAYFGIDASADHLPPLLNALSHVAHDFDPQPSVMLSVVGPPTGGVRWFTFRASTIGPGMAMAFGYFVEAMRTSLPRLVCAREDDLSGTHRVFTLWRDEHCELEVRSNGYEVLVTRGSLPDGAIRKGNAWEIGAQAVGWDVAPPTSVVTSKADRVHLRREGVPVENLALEPGVGQLPRVGVLGTTSELPFDMLRTRGALHFPQVALPHSRGAHAQGVGHRDEIVKLGRITIHTPGECPDFSGVSYAKGHLLIRGGVGQDGLATIPLIDLGDLIEMKYPSSIKAPLVPRRIVARHLTHVSELHIGQGVPQAVCQLDFPALTNLKHGTFYLQQLSLPSLREVETLTVHVSDRLHLELPQLVKGKVNIVLSKPNIDTRLVKIVAPRLRTQLEIGTSDPRAFDKKRLDAARRRIIRQFKDPAFHEMLLARMADTKSE